MKIKIKGQTGEGFTEYRNVRKSKGRVVSDSGMQTDGNVISQNREEGRTYLGRWGIERREGAIKWHIQVATVKRGVPLACVSRVRYRRLVHKKGIEKKVSHVNCCQEVR